MNRRDFVGTAGIWLAAAAIGTQEASSQTSPSTEDLYRLGTTALRRGRRFENAIKQLENAVRQSPERADYHLALGCAYASRAASVASAAEKIPIYQQRQKDYPARLHKWQETQKDLKTPDRNTSAPAEPILRTPDDELPFVQTEVEAAQTVKKLSLAAINAFDKGVALSIATSNAMAKADAKQTCGWGLALLRRYKSIREQTAVTHKQVIDAFSESISFMPEDATYWHARGAARFPLFMRDDNTVTAEHTMPSTDENSYGIADLNHALLLKPKNFDVLYQLSLVTANRDEIASLGYLQKAVSLKRSNAILGYYLGERLLVQAKKTMDPRQKQELRSIALGVVEKATNARQFEAEKVVLPVPQNLQAAWNFDEVYANNQDYGVVVRLAVQVRDYVVQVKNTDEQMQWVRCILNVGLSETRNYESAATEGKTADEAKSAQFLRFSIGVAAYSLGVGIADTVNKTSEEDETFLLLLSDAKTNLKMMKQKAASLSQTAGY